MDNAQKEPELIHIKEVMRLIYEGFEGFSLSFYRKRSKKNASRLCKVEKAVLYVPKGSKLKALPNGQVGKPASNHHNLNKAHLVMLEDLTVGGLFEVSIPLIVRFNGKRVISFVTNG
jgi:hypothetical protein